MESNQGTVARRLAAILAADAANFSGLVAADEERTLRLLSRHRAVLDRIVSGVEAMHAAGHGEMEKLEGQGSIGGRRCAVLIARGSPQ